MTSSSKSWKRQIPREERREQLQQSWWQKSSSWEIKSWQKGWWWRKDWQKQGRGHRCMKVYELSDEEVITKERVKRKTAVNTREKSQARGKTHKPEENIPSLPLMNVKTDYTTASKHPLFKPSFKMPEKGHGNVYVPHQVASSPKDSSREASRMFCNL